MEYQSGMISVIVCTRNRADSLRRTLQSLAAMAVPRALVWEILVVDNGSSDQTRGVIDEVTRTGSLPLRCVAEPTPGLARARNRGMCEARGDLIAFTDDDVRVDRGWVEAVYREFAADADLAVLGGRTLPASPETPRLALRLSTDRQSFTFPADPRQVCKGNNMAFRATVVRAVGLFDVHLGTGTAAGAAEETDYVYRALKAGYKAVYSPLPVAYHEHDRASPDALWTVRLAYTRAWGAFLCKHMLRGDRWAAGMFGRETRRLIQRARQAPRERRRHVRRLRELLWGALLRIPAEISGATAASDTGGASSERSTSSRTSRGSFQTSARIPPR